MLLVAEEADTDDGRYSGVLDTSAGQYWLTLVWRNTQSEFYPEWRLEELLQDRRRQVAGLLKSSSSPHHFATQLESLVERITSSQGLQEGPSPAVVQSVLQELHDIGSRHIASVSSSFHEIKMQVRDSGSRVHTCACALSPSYPQRPPKCTTALPISFSPSWKEASGLTTLFVDFKHTTERLQPFWNNVQGLYDATAVLDPPKFDASATVFRVGIGDGTASLQLSLDPLHPLTDPRVQFLGPDHATKGLAGALARHEWTETQTVAENLITAIPSLQRSQIQRSADGGAINDPAEDISRAECGVCYTYKLDGAFPDQVCPNGPCSRSFHPSCLEEWLQALPDTRHAFDTLFGACPYCESQLSLKLKR